MTDTDTVNPFTSVDGARLYAEGRPFHHPRAVKRICSLVDNARPSRALDIACGTGLSTRALAEIAGEVVGVDVAVEMLDQAEPDSRIQYLVASAESLPFDDASFDAITVSSAVHWFDHEVFFHEARRLLKPGGWLAVYDHSFLGIQDDVAFQEWSQNPYLARYPTPPRGPKFDLAVTPVGFARVGDSNGDDPIKMTHIALVDYLLTQSNCIAALEANRVTHEHLRSWLKDETARFFAAATPRTFRFYLTVSCLRPT